MPSSAYSKPALVRRMIRFSLGFHQLRGANRSTCRTHPHLILAHLHHIDNASCWERELSKHRDFHTLGSVASERKVTWETKTHFDTLVQQRKVCNYAHVASTAPARNGPGTQKELRGGTGVGRQQDHSRWLHYVKDANSNPHGLPEPIAKRWLATNA